MESGSISERLIIQNYNRNLHNDIFESDEIVWKNAQNEKFQILSEAVENIRDGKEELAKEMLMNLISNLRMEMPSDNLQYIIFTSALLKRLRSEFIIEQQNNIYLINYERSQIDLFNLLVTRIPLVNISYLIANELICKFISGREEATLVDIGIGNGRQEIELIKLLCQKKAAPKKLNIVGIEPLSNNLCCAEKGLFNIANKLKIDLEFYPITKLIEDLNNTDWNMLEKLPGSLIINESFAVHHVLDKEGLDCRDEIFSRLKKLNPLAFILTEPHSDHYTDDIWVRFNNCWKHFGLTFNIIDKINISDQDKIAIKILFFGREIEDILGSEDKQRCERHETAQMWADRLRKAGFKLNHDFDFLRTLPTDIIKVVTKKEYIGLEYKDETIVSILCGV